MNFPLFGRKIGRVLYCSFALGTANIRCAALFMTAFSDNTADPTIDIELGIDGFRYSDLYDAVKLKQLAEIFYLEVEKQDPLLSNALNKYIAARGGGFRAAGRVKDPDGRRTVPVGFCRPAFQDHRGKG